MEFKHSIVSHDTEVRSKLPTSVFRLYEICHTFQDKAKFPGNVVISPKVIGILVEKYYSMSGHLLT